MVVAPLRLDYVSPLPPVRSGIADYSLDLLPHLAARADVRVIRLPGQPVDEAVAERWRPVAAAETGAGGRLPVYQMGNNRHHAPVRDLAGERPGVLTLHDLVLHHLLAESTLGRGDYAGYAAALAGDYGWLGGEVARPRRWGGASDAGLFALPAYRALLRTQRGVVVHSRWAAERVAEDEPDLAVRVVPMGVPLPPAADPAAASAFRRRYGLSAEVPLLGSFGFQTKIKRTLIALAALAQPPLEDARLLIVGEVAHELDYQAEARRLGVAGRVVVTGFVGYDEFLAAIAATDLCLNLRYPTAGETSASLLRVLACGRPALVSDYAQFAELPDEVAVKAPLGGAAVGSDGDDEEAEARALAAAAAELLARRERLREMGEAAREYVRVRHDPEAAAKALVAACRELGQREPPGGEPSPPPPPTTLTCRRLAGAIEVAGAERPWPEGERRTLRVTLRNRGPERWLAARRGTGGVALQVQLNAMRDGRWDDLLAGLPWLPLPVDLAAGEAATVEVDVRRPPRPARLRVEGRLVGVAGFADLGGPSWEAEL